MKKRLRKRKITMAAFLTVFFLAMTAALSGQTVSALAQETDSEKHDTNVGDTPGQEDEGPGDTAEEDNKNPGDTAEEDNKNPGDTVEGDNKNPGDTAEEDNKNPGDTAEEDNKNPEQQPDPEDKDPEDKDPEDTSGQEDNKTDDQESDEEIAKHASASVKLAGNAKDASISWKHVQGAVTYKVQRSNKKQGGFKNIASLDENGRNYTDKSVKRGSSYFYRIAVKMENGGTVYSDVLSFTCPLGKVSDIKLVRYSTSSIKVLWDKSKDQQTKYYKVYYAKSKSGNYKLAGVTQNTWYRVKDLDNHQDYYFRVKACAAKKASSLDSAASEPVSMRTKSYSRTTIFAGDSITVGLRTYNILNEIAIGGNKGIVAAVGLNTTTFRTRRVFDGKTGLESIVAAKPYRVYIMLGDNEIHYRSKEDAVAGYREILKGIKAGSPDTDIVVLAATPVTSAKVAERSGFAQIPAYNQSLKALAKSMGARYFDCTDFLKDSSGWLKSAYAAGDGIHWTASAYHEYGKRLEAYDKSLD